MVDVKQIVVRVIPSQVAVPFVREHHYSGKVVNNSKLHFGCFYKNILHGVMSFGCPMDKKKVISLVTTANKTEAQKWCEMLELNRMAFDDFLPKNSESRCLGVAFRLIRKNAPHIKWILSFSDGTQSGDGTIYRAVGFHLTQIRENNTILVMPDGEKVCQLSITNGFAVRKKLAQKFNIPLWGGGGLQPLLDAGARKMPGFQLRYIKLLTPDCELNCPDLPFTAIDDAGAGMLRGERVSRAERHRKSDANQASPNGAGGSE